MEAGAGFEPAVEGLRPPALTGFGYPALSAFVCLSKMPQENSI